MSNGKVENRWKIHRDSARRWLLLVQYEWADNEILRSRIKQIILSNENN